MYLYLSVCSVGIKVACSWEKNSSPSTIWPLISWLTGSRSKFCVILEFIFSSGKGKCPWKGSEWHVSPYTVWLQKRPCFQAEVEFLLRFFMLVPFRAVWRLEIAAGLSRTGLFNSVLALLREHAVLLLECSHMNFSHTVLFLKSILLATYKYKRFYTAAAVQSREKAEGW